MTGRDLIVYILSNHLEDEPVFKDGKFVGLLTAEEAAAKLNVGVSTIRAWYMLGRLKGIVIGDSIYIPGDCKLEDVNE